jgi:hypothetical protein
MDHAKEDHALLMENVTCIFQNLFEPKQTLATIPMQPIVVALPNRVETPLPKSSMVFYYFQKR